MNTLQHEPQVNPAFDESVLKAAGRTAQIEQKAVIIASELLDAVMVAYDEDKPNKALIPVFIQHITESIATARAEGAAEVLQIIKGVTYYVEYPVETFEYDRMAGKVIVGSHENPIEMLSKRDVEVFNATAKMIWGKVNKNIEALTTKEIDHAE